MPFLDDELEVGAREPGLLLPPKPSQVPLIPGTPDPTKPPEVTLGGVLGAAARDENMMVSAFSYATERAGNVHDPDHNPLDMVGGTKYENQYLDRFVGSRNAFETKSIMSRIDQEESDDRLLDAAGWGGIVARIGMGVLDPTLFIPFGAYYKGARAGGAISRSALGIGAGAGAQAAISESVLYGTQETRSLGEVGANVAGATILGGLLGGAIGAMTAKEIADATNALNDIRTGINREMEAGVPRAQPAGAAVAVREGLTLEPAFGAEKALSKLSPITRLQTSEFETARATVRDLADAGLSYRENWEGVPTSAGGTVETRVKMWNGPLYDSIATMDDAYGRYWFGREDITSLERRSAPMRAGWANMRGTSGGKLTFQEFREEIGKAMARGDQHPIPQVAEAAKEFRAKVFDPAKQEAIKLGLLEDADDVVGAMSYITRLYNREMIVARRDRWNSILEAHFAQQRDARVATLTREGKELDSFAQMGANEIKELVNSVTNKILGESAMRLAGVRIGGKEAAPLMKRVLTVPDEMMEEFLIRDIEKVARAYTRSLAPDIELTKKFGDVGMKEQLAKLQDEFNAKVNAAPSAKERARLDHEYKAAAERIGATRDRIRNIYGAPSNPDGLLHRAGKLALNLNYLARLGGMTISSFPDLARPIMRYGLNAFRDGWIPLITNFSAVKLSANEVKLAGTALDMVRDQRLLDIADLLDDYGRTSKFERGVQLVADKFGMLTLMSPWNGALKQLTGTITMAEVMRATKAVANGKATAKQIQKLAADGVDETMAKRIWAEAETSGTDVRGVFLPNTEDWTDLKAVEAFRAIVVREVETLIVTPGLEKPLWMSKDLGRIIGQFKSFATASTQRTLLAGLQQKDAAALTGVLTALALGAFTAKIKATARGEDTREWGPGRWAAEAFDNSGLGGAITEAGNIADKWTGGKVGLARLGGEEVSRYQSRNAVGAMLGPTFDFAGDLAQVTRAVSTGEVTRSDLHALRQVLPMQNLFYIRRLFDKAEEAIGDRMDLPARRRRR